MKIIDRQWEILKKALLENYHFSTIIQHKDFEVINFYDEEVYDMFYWIYDKINDTIKFERGEF